ncbi:hypothetical protein EJ04DRAFT_296738 [Polyplosphaeria fusca]|uniref:Uncharacterized protein n=1 Tax=Polyplosphaeria fusca TaxID=682080 RepID=A0A9P4QSJ7_9PLEO|nr:hypothetical protein EJ04DRAFT_296738 [Polyplosphaeria fusca]
MAASLTSRPHLSTYSTNDSLGDAFFSLEESDPLLFEDMVFGEEGARLQSVDHEDAPLPEHGEYHLSVRPTAQLRHSSSEHVLGSRHLVLPSDQTSHVDRHKRPTFELKKRSPKREASRLTDSNHRVLRRTTSNTSIERRLPHHDSAVDSGTLRKRLIMQTKHTGKEPVRPWRVRRARTASSPFRWTASRSPSRPGFKWFPRRSSEPTTPAVKKKGRHLPLKPCMKRESKSTTHTPSNERSDGSEDLAQVQKLRRVKTVDFEDTVSKRLLALPPLKVWTDETRPSSPDDGRKIEPPPTRAARRVSTHFEPTTKSKPAEPAITRTDVHVVAIAPSWNEDVVPDEGGIDPATPTMQIVESAAGCYEVIWDDIEPQHDIQRARRSSSASIALRSAGSSPLKGLERVNSKLTEWSWGRQGLPEPFKPQIVVFPDDDGQDTTFDSAVDHDELLIIAPPNSVRGSATVSRRASQPSIARTARTESHKELDPEEMIPLSPEQLRATQAPLDVPTPDASKVRPGQLIGASRRTKMPVKDRRLSNVEDSELKFRGHRDSVTLARSRIFNAGGVSPELFMHRDSVSMAKKRMHAKNHATLGARDIPHADNGTDDMSHAPRPEVDHVHEGSLSAQKHQDAVQGLKTSNSTSMLQAPPSPPHHRHIRIME